MVDDEVVSGGHAFWLMSRGENPITCGGGRYKALRLFSDERYVGENESFAGIVPRHARSVENYGVVARFSSRRLCSGTIAPNGAEER